MSEKDIWKWLLPKFTNELIYDIYIQEKIVCNGFRATSIKDKNSNRKLFLTNLLNKSNYNKLIRWSREKIPQSLMIEEEVSAFELEELLNITSKNSVMKILLKLLNGNHDKKAVQFFSYLKDRENDLLSEDEPKKNSEPNDQEKIENIVLQTGNSKELERINKKLSKKVEKVQEEIERQKNSHLMKVADLEKNIKDWQNKWNEKNQEIAVLNQLNTNLKRLYEEEVSYREKERKEREKILQKLKSKEEMLSETIEVKDNPADVLVIGEPMYTNQFKSKNINFTFVKGSNLQQYDFSEQYDAIWILTYELSVKHQVWLEAKINQNNIDSAKIIICKDFNEVKTYIELHNQHEERVLYVRK